MRFSAWLKPCPFKPISPSTNFSPRPLKRMRAVCTQRELYLHQEFVRIDVTCITREPVLAAHLAKLARPVRQDDRATFVGLCGKLSPVGTIEAPAQEPAASQLVIARGIEPEGPLLEWQLLALAPD